MTKTVVKLPKSFTSDFGKDLANQLQLDQRSIEIETDELQATKDLLFSKVLSYKYSFMHSTYFSLVGSSFGKFQGSVLKCFNVSEMEKSVELTCR